MIEYSDDLLLEQAYLVARGVRPLALIGNCEADDATVRAVLSRLKVLAGGTVIAYIVPAINPASMTYGYASESWAIDLLRWALSEECPADQRHRITGLLLGFSADEIRRYESLGAGTPPTEF